MAGINETFKEGGIVTKNDMCSVFWRSFPLQASFNYERMQNVGFCYSLLPVLKTPVPGEERGIRGIKTPSVLFQYNASAGNFHHRRMHCHGGGE